MRADEVRNYEMVTPEEFRQLNFKNFKYPDLYRAIRALRKMATGEGVKIPSPSVRKEARKMQKAAGQIARREKVTIRTRVRGEWLFIEKVKNL